MAFKNVIIKGKEQVIEYTGTAGGAITPGHLLDLSDNTALVVHASANQNAAKAFAIENDGIGNGIDDAYANGDTTRFVLAQSGCVIYALVAAGATAISEGDELESAGDGTLQAHSVLSSGSIYTDAIVAYADEDKDNSGGSSAVRIKARIA